MRLKLTLAYATLFAATVVLGALGVYFELLDASGHLLDTAGRRGKAPHGLPLTLGALSAEERRVLTVALPAGVLLRVSRRDDTVREVLETLAMVAAACGVGYLLADRALRPVDAAARRDALGEARGGEGERVPVRPGGDEMARLTRTVNAMLDRLETTIERERRFARTTAHELRTPLTALRGHLDLALDRPRDALEYGVPRRPGGDARAGGAPVRPGRATARAGARKSFAR